MAAPAARGSLYLVAVPLGDIDPGLVLSAAVLETIRNLDGFIAEEQKSARAFLKRVQLNRPLPEVEIQTLDEHTASSQLPALLAPLLDGKRLGLLSEAGYPAVADPGANLVAFAHQHGVRVVPLVGPSSLLMALAASGLNGQQFACHGYLPVSAPERTAALRELESRSAREGSAQLFIEAPYRNNQMLAALLEACAGSTRVCLAVELSLPDEFVHTRTIAQWKQQTPDLNRRPTVFVLQAEPSAARIGSPRAATLPPSRRRSGVRSAQRYSRAG